MGSGVILNTQVIGIMYLVVASNIAVFKMAGYETVVYGAVKSNVVLSEMVIHGTVVLQMVVYEDRVAVSSESCPDIASEVAVGAWKRVEGSYPSLHLATSGK